MPTSGLAPGVRSSTRTRKGGLSRRSREGRSTLDRRITTWFATAVAAAILASAFAAALARADGDPASDVLLAQDVFYPYSPPVSESLQKSLNAETTAARDAGFPIKVALIHSPLDLGAVQGLFDKPQQYADFLEQEIDYQSGQPLLVVMPNGYGVQDLSTATTAAAASLARPTGSQTDDLARAAVNAVQALASAAGYRIEAGANSVTAGTGHHSATLPLAALALGALAAAGALIAVRGREQLWWGDRAPPGGAYEPAARQSSGAGGAFAYGLRGRAVQPLLVAGLVLILGGLVWVVPRGLEFYGLSPVEVGYDLDQPPLLLVLVGAWLWYRSRRR